MFSGAIALLSAAAFLGAGAAPPDQPRAQTPLLGTDPHAARALGASPEPLSIGESFILDSTIMGEQRRINVMIPTMFGQAIDEPMPVLYMLDGGLAEDFLHIAGLVQVLVCNGGMRPFMLVGVENTQRRRDLTGPTSNEEDRKIAPVVGGSARFRQFIRDELMPAVRSRYRVTDESAIIGESLAGLFVLETLMLEPGLFKTYIAVDPSLWWNSGALVRAATGAVPGSAAEGRVVFIAGSHDDIEFKRTASFAAVLKSWPAVSTTYVPLPAESHATVYHPAALLGFRAVLAPSTARGK